MVVCPNGSAPQANTPDFVVITNDFMASILPGPLAWLRPFLPYIPPLRVTTGEFCAEEPPGYPDTSLVEWAALLVGSPFQAVQESGRQTAQILYNILWYTLCECLVDATPAIPSAPAAPTGLPAINPPDIVTNPALPCRSWVSEIVGLPNLSSPMLVGIRTADGGPVASVPPGTTSLVMTVRNIATGGVHAPATFLVRPYSTATTETAGTTFDVASGATATWTFPFPAGYYGFTLEVGKASGTNVTDLAQANVDAYCGGAMPGQPASPCCTGPSADQLAALQQILEYVRLIQRQAAPFAYVYGANHVGLSGTGEITDVSGLLGISVDVTTLPEYLGRADGTPETLFELGYVTLGTADGWSTSRRIDHDGTLVLPQAAGLYTSIGYTLAPDVVVAIRELVREP